MVSPSPTFLTEAHGVHTPAKTARGRVSSRANQMSPPSALLNYLKGMNGTPQRFSTTSHRLQCFEDEFRMLFTPESGSILRSSFKSASFLLARSLPASLDAASSCAP